MLRVLPFLALFAPSVALADAPTHAVRLEAKIAAAEAPLADGVRWRVFRERRVDDAARTPLIAVAEAEGGTTELRLPAGAYYLHTAYGQAGRTVQLTVEGDMERSIVLDAGGLSLDATAGGEAIDPSRLRFDIYEHRQDAAGKRRIVAFNVAPGRVARLNAGTYHVVSRYGRLRTEVRADLVVRAGQTTQAVLQHRGAEVGLKLVSAPGGIPIANTAWSVFSDQGEKLFESARNAPRIVLSEGDYEVVAQNGARTVKQSFTVAAGQTQDLELLLP